MRWLLVAVVCVGLAGCVQPAPLLPGDEDVRFLHGGLERRFVVHVPDADGPLPLLLLLHGSQGDAATIRQQSGMDAWADSEGFIVAYPEGTPYAAGKPGLAWNAVHCCGAPFGRIDDVGFLTEVIDRIERRGDIASVHVAGRSGGAMMAYRLAVEHDGIASVSAVAGAIGGRPAPGADVLRPEPPGRPVSALIIHAEDDPNVPPASGRGPKTLGRHSHLPLQDAIDFWIDSNQARRVASPVVPGATASAQYEGDGGARVVVVETRGGHGWPGGKQVGGSVPPRGPDASALIGAFVTAQ